MKTLKFRAYSNFKWEYSKEMPDLSFWKWVAYDSTIEVMQFTGLFDKNGTPIYEGDIVKTDYNGGFIGNIEYRLGEWLIMRGTADILADLHKNNWDIEVIGNIYENPDLLKEEQQDKSQEEGATS